MDEPGVLNQDSGKNTKQKRKGQMIKISVLVLIVVAVAGVFLIKNAAQGPPAESKTAEPDNIASQEAGIAKNTAALEYSAAEFDLDATENFDLEKFMSYGLPVIIDFGADSCIPCKEMAPVLKELNKELRGKAIVKFVDVWKNTDAGQAVPLKVIPTQFFFDKNGKPYVPADTKSSAFLMYKLKDTEEHVFTAHEGGMDKEAILAVLKELGVE